MNTQNTTPSTAPKTTTSGGPSKKVVAALVAGGVAIAGIATGLTLTLTSPSAHAATAAGTSSTTGGTTNPAHHEHGHRPNTVLPSAAVKTLQEELGQLNYYEGPVTGYMNHATEQAITYLQRDAHLPQTGVMNHATRVALTQMLANGNNQMGGNGTHHAPSAAVTKLQQELGQLNYYEGPVTGHRNAATTQAITYLQRDAHLPQTGVMNHATRVALAQMLANGNNQMGS